MSEPVRAPDIPRGPCGTSGCTDLGCAIEPGTCHCGCGQRTAPARQTCRRNLLVQGEPQRYVHGHQIPTMSRARWKPTSAAREERRRRTVELYHELRSHRAVARQVGLSSSTVWAELRDAGVIRRLAEDELTVWQAVSEYEGLKFETLAAAIDEGRVPGERIVSAAGNTRRIVRREDLERCLAEMRCDYHGCDLPALGRSRGCEFHGHAIEQADTPRPPGVRAAIVRKVAKDFSDAGLGNYLYGRHAALLASTKPTPKSVGKKPEVLTEDVKHRILELRAQPTPAGRRRSQRQIADIVGVSRGSVEHVLRHYALDDQGALQKVA